jgi:hypothetical protein
MEMESMRNAPIQFCIFDETLQIPVTKALLLFGFLDGDIYLGQPSHHPHCLLLFRHAQEIRTKQSNYLVRDSRITIDLRCILLIP